MVDPTGGQRVGFWLLLRLASTAFAEVLFPTTAFDIATMALFAVPIYLLHSVVLAGVVYRTDRVSYQTLYLVGVLLGLSESYVTKVVWAPLGDRPFVFVGGVSVFETAGLVLFWHPVVAFLLPVSHLPILAYYFLAGGLLAALLRGDGSSPPGVPVRITWRRLLASALAVVLGSAVLGLVGAAFALSVFLSYYAVALGVGVASLGAVALALRRGPAS
jgi:hypothetical protein